MLLQNKIAVNYNRVDGSVEFTKLINNKLWKLSTICGSCKMFFMVVEGYSSYTDEEFINEAEATK